MGAVSEQVSLPSKVFLDVRLETWNREKVLEKVLKEKSKKNTD